MVLSIATILSLITKDGERHEGNEQLAALIGTRFIPPAGSDIDSSGLTTMVIYFDSATCATCQLKQIWEWNSLLAEADTCHGFSPLFIMEPRRSDSLLYVEELGKAEILYPLVTDFNREFIRDNPLLSCAREYHVFLTDREGKIVLAGNPLHNRLLWEIYLKYIDELVCSGGYLSEEFYDEIATFISRRNHPENGLLIDCLKANIGDISTNTTATVTFSGHNISDKTIIINQILTDCECVTCTSSAFEIGPGAQCVFTVTFTPDTKGTVYHNVWINTSESEEETCLTISGRCI